MLILKVESDKKDFKRYNCRLKFRKVNPQWFRTTTFGQKIMDEILIVGASDNMYESFAGIFFCLKVIFGTKTRKESRNHRQSECEKTKNLALGALSLMINY